MKRVLKELLSASARIEPISRSEESVFEEDYMHLQRYHPAVGAFCAAKPDATMPSMWRISEWKSDSLPVCNVTITNGATEIKSARAYVKVTHVLNPIMYLKGDYYMPDSCHHPFLPVASDTWSETVHKLNSHNNQAYVDVACAYVVSRFRELDLMPHFPLYYGSATGIAKRYKYNISDDFESYRNCRWFWRGINALDCELKMDSDDPDIIGLVLNCPYTDEELAAEDESSCGESVKSEILEAADVAVVDSASLHSADDLPDGDAGDGDSSSGTSSGETEELEPNITLNIPNMPVAFIYQEAHEGTMDSLLDLEDINGHKHGTKAWEEHWIAWLWQIIAALAFLQRTIGFTHNDLHTNNIVWRKTEEKYLYYRSSRGTVWRIPTFGKIFSIIDYGRAIFHIGNMRWLSDNFESCEDADGQYNFGPIYDKSMPKVVPNYSFDLCRLAISVLDGAYPDKYPKSIADTSISSVISCDNDGWVVHETKSDLFNLLWSWTVDGSGASVYETASGEERYPGFELYVRIAADCRAAVPRDQLARPVFERFIFKERVPKGKKIYHIV